MEADAPIRESAVKEDVQERLLVVGGAATTETESVLAAMALAAMAYFDGSCQQRGDVLVGGSGGSGGMGVDLTSTAPDSGSASLDAAVF